MSRGVATILFLAITAPTNVHTAGTLGNALQEATLRAWLLFGEAGMKSAVLTAFALFIFLRPPSRKPSRQPVAWLSCAAAILAAAFLYPPQDDTAMWAVVTGEAIVIFGVGFTLFSVAFLGRCFGVLPEVRGLVMRGPYHIIRHPVYLGEIVAFVGFVVTSQRLMNVLPLLAFVVAQSVRMRLEEGALLEEFPDEYGAYAASTPRLVPRLPGRSRPSVLAPELANPAQA